MVIKALAALYYISFFLIYVGFVFYGNPLPYLGPYFMSYRIFLVLLAFGFLPPFLIKLILKKYGARSVILSLVSIVAKVLAIL